MPPQPFQAPEPNQERSIAIAVCGSGAEDAHLNALAEAVGSLIAQRGATLICGGLGGVMAAACRGARQAGGLTIGILPSADPASANPYVQVAVASGLGHARNVLIVQSAAAVIAIGGEYGTLSEIALARKVGRPVVGLSSWPLGEPHLTTAVDPATAVALAFALASR